VSMTNKRRPTVTVQVEAEVETRLQQIQDAYGSLCSRTSVCQMAMELGLMVMAMRAAAVNENILLFDFEKVQLRKLKRELPE